MSTEFLEALTRVQALQRRFTSDMNSFSVVVKYDDYFEDYLEVELQTDNDKFFFTTYSCLYEEDYELRIKELEKTINEIIQQDGD